MPNLKPFRDYDRHEVINLFAYNYTGSKVNKGTFVKVATGYKSDDDLFQFESIAPDGESNIVSHRYAVKSRVTAAGSGDTPIGMTLNDVRETDENGDKLLHNEQKKIELDAVISGEAVPIVSRGLFLYKGIDGSPSVGANAYVSGNGEVTTTKVYDGHPVVGKFLGGKDDDNYALLKVEL